MTPTMAKAQSTVEILEAGMKKAKKNLKKFKENGSICLECGKNPGEKESKINPLCCVDCNAETEALLKQLRGPGFMELKI